jgi:hypothetical protein
MFHVVVAGIVQDCRSLRAMSTDGWAEMADPWDEGRPFSEAQANANGGRASSRGHVAICEAEVIGCVGDQSVVGFEAEGRRGLRSGRLGVVGQHLDAEVRSRRSRTRCAAEYDDEPPS